MEDDFFDLYLVHNRFLQKCGLSKFKTYFYNRVLRIYKEQSLPVVLKSVSHKIFKLEKNLTKEANLIGANELTSKFITTYITKVQEVLTSTSGANAAHFGTTLKEERDEQFNAEWNFNGTVPYQYSKLHGGSQITRLLQEFRIVANAIEIPKDEIESLPAPKDKNFLFRCCDLVVRQLESLIPIVDTLLSRLTFIFKKVPVIVEELLKTDKEMSSLFKWFSGNQQHFKHLSNHLEEKFFDFVERTSAITKQKLLEQFYTTKTLIYFVGEMNLDPQILKDGPQLVDAIFVEMKKRIVANILCRVHKFFLLPFIETAVWDELLVVDQFALESLEFKNIVEDHKIQVEKTKDQISSLIDLKKSLEKLVVVF